MHWHIALFNVHCIISLKYCNSCRGQWLKKKINSSAWWHVTNSPSPTALKKILTLPLPFVLHQSPKPTSDLPTPSCGDWLSPPGIFIQPVEWEGPLSLCLSGSCPFSWFYTQTLMNTQKLFHSAIRNWTESDFLFPLCPLLSWLPRWLNSRERCCFSFRWIG